MIRATAAQLVVAALAVAFTGAAKAQPDPAAMDRYWFGLLSRGPTWTPKRTARTDSIQAGHLANIERMWKLGSLLVAGPFEGAGARRGVFIFRDDSLELIRRLSAADPAIASGRLKLDLFEWWAPKGIGAAYRARAEAKPNRKDSMVVVQLAFLKLPAKAVSKPPEELDRLQKEHVENIIRLLASGKMPVAGPFGGDGEYRGVCVFTTSPDEARASLGDDPLVSAGLLEIDMLPWWVADGAFMPAAATQAADKAAIGDRKDLASEKPARDARLAPGTAAPQDPGWQRPEIGEYVPVDELPEAISKVEPVYPEDAKRAGIAGTVMVQALVLGDGSVDETHIVKSVPGLDKAAAACVRQWRFKPAMSKGAPVAVWVVVPIPFGP